MRLSSYLTLFTLLLSVQAQTNVTITLQFPFVFPITLIIPFAVRLFDAVILDVNQNIMDGKYQFDLQILDYANNDSIARTNIASLIADNDTFFYFGSVSPGHSDILLEEIASAGVVFPVISPLDTKDRLRVTDNNDSMRNWIHPCLASTTDEIVSAVWYATNVLQITRIGAIDGGLELKVPFEETMKAAGLRPIVYVERSKALGVTQEEIDTLIEAKPQMILLQLFGSDIAPFLTQIRDQGVLNDTIFMIPSLSATSSGLEFALNTEETVRNVYTMTSLEPWSTTDSKLIQRMKSVVAAHDPNLFIEGAAFGYSPGIGDISITKAMYWLAHVLNTVDDLNRTSLIDAIYQRNALTQVLESPIGTFFDQCDSEIYSCCNQGVHSMHINSLSVVFPGAISEWTSEAVFTWKDCSSLVEDAATPLLLGVSQNIKDSSSNVDIQSGIKMALLDTVEQNYFNERNALLLSYDSSPANSSDELAQELVLLDSVNSLVGISDTMATIAYSNLFTDTLIWSMSIDQTLRNIDAHPNVISLFPGLRDRVYACLVYAFGSPENQQEKHTVFVLDGDIESEVQYWSEDFNVVDIKNTNIQSDSLVILNKKDGVFDVDLICIVDLLNIEEQNEDLNVVFVLPVPVPSWNASAIVTKHEDMIDDYLASSTGNTTTVEYSGYVLGRFVSRLLSSINGQITAQRVFEAIYDLQVLSEGGLTAGVFTEDTCNQGLHQLYIVDSNSLLEIVEWNGCGAQLLEQSGNKNGDGGQDLGIIAGSMGSFLLLLIIVICFAVCVCAILAMVVVVASTAVIRQKRKHDSQYLKLVEPDYRKIAFPDECIKSTDDMLLFYSRGSSNLKKDLELFKDMVFEWTYAIPIFNTLKNCTDDSNHLAAWVLYLYSYKGMEKQLLYRFIRDEIRNNSKRTNVLFRADSFLTKMFRWYSFLEGLEYLWITLAQPMALLNQAAKGNRGIHVKLYKRDGTTRISDTRNTGGTWEDSDEETTTTTSTSLHTMEIDPSKNEGDQGDIFASVNLLQHHAQKIFNAINHSTFPPRLSEFVRVLARELNGQHKDIGVKLPHDEIVALVASFVFLRFLCPALLSPHIYGLLDETPNSRTHRVFILLSKLIQNLASGLYFTKEVHMQRMNTFIEFNIDDRDKFLGLIMGYETLIGDSGTDAWYPIPIDSDDSDDDDNMYTRVPVSDTTFQISLEHLFAQSLNNKDDIIQALSVSLTEEQMDECYYDYLEPLGWVDNKKEVHKKKDIYVMTSDTSSTTSSTTSDASDTSDSSSTTSDSDS